MLELLPIDFYRCCLVLILGKAVLAGNDVFLPFALSFLHTRFAYCWIQVIHFSPCPYFGCFHEHSVTADFV